MTFERVIFGHFGGQKIHILDFSRLFWTCFASIWVLFSFLKGRIFDVFWALKVAKLHRKLNFSVKCWPPQQVNLDYENRNIEEPLQTKTTPPKSNPLTTKLKRFLHTNWLTTSYSLYPYLIPNLGSREALINFTRLPPWRFGLVFEFDVLRFLDSDSDSHSIKLNFKIRVKIRIRCFMILRFDSLFVFDDLQFSDSDSDSYSWKSNFQIRIRIRIRVFMNSRFVFGFDPNPNHTSFCDSRIIWFDRHCIFCIE